MRNSRQWMQFCGLLCAIVLIALVVIVVRVHLADIPFERDEGEYAYAGQLILKGIPPYSKVYNMKMPGIYLAYALMMSISGETHQGIHLALIVVNLATCVLLFFFGRKLADSITGVSAAAAYAVLSVSPSVLGFSANAEHFVVLVALAGLLLLFRAMDSNSLVALLFSGVLLGLAVTTKQHGAAFGLFGIWLICYRALRGKSSSKKSAVSSLLVFGAGLAIPYTVVCLWLWWMGVFDKFWFWTMTYAWEYATRISLKEVPSIFLDAATEVIWPASLLWLLAAVGVSTLFWKDEAKSRRWDVIAFVVFSFIAVCPGFYFRPHYFILFLPAVALCVGLAVSGLLEAVRGFKYAYVAPLLIFVVAFAQPIYEHRAFFLEKDSAKASRMVYGANPFPESLQIAEYLSRHSSPGDTVAILGSEPQIYFYSKRESATGYVYMYPLMEKHRLAEEMLLEMTKKIESNPPKFLVFVRIRTSWLWNQESGAAVLRWFADFYKRHYRQVGFAEISSTRPTTFTWDATHPSGSREPLWIMVLERRN